MKCLNCGAENLDSSQTCFQCGREIKIKKNPFGILKKIGAVLAVIIVVCFIINYFRENNEYVDRVKNGYLTEYSSRVTVGTAFENFFGNPKWEYGETEYGEKFVNFTGRCMYLDKEVTVVIQFMLEERNGFSIYAMEMNEVPQNLFIIMGMMEVVYEDYGG